MGPYLFTFAAGSFFQNNNSILIPLTEYVKSAISTTLPKPSHLVDTYCGSGLFGITLSSSFERVAGVEISSDSIKAAKVNAEINGLGDKTEWLCGKAEDIFGGLAEKGFEGGKSCVVVDVSYTSLPPGRSSSLVSPDPLPSHVQIHHHFPYLFPSYLLATNTPIFEPMISPPLRAKLTTSPHEKDVTPHS